MYIYNYTALICNVPPLVLPYILQFKYNSNDNNNFISSMQHLWKSINSTHLYQQINVLIAV